MTVCVLGLGYIGLPLALLLADNGVKVLGFDVDAQKLARLENNLLTLKERGLEQLFASVQKKGTFSVVQTVPTAESYIIAVPTPQTDRHSDLSYIYKSLEFIHPHYQPGSLIVLESTVGPSDCESKIIPELRKWNVDFKFAHCPERAVPGNTLQEMTRNDRVIGGITRQDAKSAQRLYKKFVTGSISLTTPNQAATVKTMENTYRAVNIALANEFAKIATELHLDVWEAIALANHHPRVAIHRPSVGVGGHCIPVDPWFFVGESKQSQLIEAALLVNQQMPQFVADKVQLLIKQHKIKKPMIGLLGYTYKKNVDDTRETPVEHLIACLESAATILITDPYLTMIKGRKLESLDTLLSTVSIVILTTDHNEFSKILFKNYPNIKIVYDTQHLFTPKNFEGSSSYHYVLGKG